MRVWHMRTGISITLKPADRRRLKVLARDRNAPHKHVWRAEIVLLSADGVGTNEIMRRTGKSVVDLQETVSRFVVEHNSEPKPFTWTADPDKIIRAVERPPMPFLRDPSRKRATP